MKKIGIYSSHHKDPQGHLSSKVFSRLSQDFPDMVMVKVYEKEDVHDLDLLLVLGGDGTLLSAARLSYGSQVPLLGVNIGTMGFMTGTDQPGLNEALMKIIEGKYSIEDRMMLETTMHCADGDKVFHGLNDIVIHKGALANIIYFEMFVDGNFATSYRGVKLEDVDHWEVENLEITNDAVITTTKAKYPCKVLRLDDYDYFDVLRQKLTYKAMNIERGKTIED